MNFDSWPESANRRLRALLWKGCSAHEIAVALGRSLPEVSGQIRRLGIPMARNTSWAALAD